MKNNIDGKIDIKRNREDFYILQVNEQGDTIELDLTDIMLPQKIINASKNILEINKDYENEILKILDEKETNEEEMIEKMLEVEIKKCQELRKEFDSFLGENACQKIFGDRNCREMFIEFMDALEPHFKKMKFKQEEAKKKLASKYLPQNKDVI